MQKESPNTSPTVRKTILMLSSTYPRWKNDHEPNFVHELSKRIAQYHNVYVISPREKDANVYEELDEVHVYRHRYAPNTASTLIANGGMGANVKRNLWKWCLLPTFILSQVLLTYRVARKIRPDIIHAHWIIPQGIVAICVKALIKNSPPLIITSHGGDLYTFNSKIFKKIKQYILSRTDTLAVVSPAMKDYLNNGPTIVDKIRVLPMGVDTDEQFTPRPAIIRGKDQVLFVGRLVEKKGLEHLLTAMPGILTHHSTATLLIIGDGPYRDALQQITKDLAITKHVKFLGGLPNQDLIRYYRESSVFVAPFVTAHSGDREGLGLVIIEALSCNCPIVVSKNESLREICAALTGNKWVQTVPEGEPTSISEAVADILTALKSEQPPFTEQHRLIATQYSWATASNNYLKAYEKCIASNDKRKADSFKTASKKGSAND
jgi:glycosyltransferase involved in cell wall biosynthesis